MADAPELTMNGVGIQGIVSAALALALSMATASAQHRRTNPPVDPLHGLESQVPTPPNMAAILHRACYDCHSNETHWRWYSRMPILSSLIAGDVERARRAMNFSDWADRMASRPAVAASTLLACCVALQSGKMPKAPYGFFHPKSRVSVSEKNEFCGWSRGEAKRLFEQRPRGE